MPNFLLPYLKKIARGTGANLCAAMFSVFVAGSAVPIRPAAAAAADYRFELVIARPGAAGQTDVTIRLIRQNTSGASAQTVSDAVIFQTRADMSPAGMGSMTAAVKPETAEQPGHYRFLIDAPMAGAWALTLSARVQGEADVVRGTLYFHTVK